MTTPTEPAVPSQPPKEPLEAGTHLRLSIFAYVAINLAYGLPIALWPDLIWKTIAGTEGEHLEALRSVRWAGALLVAWAIGGLLTLTRPEGRQTMVTTFALQYSFAAVALVVSSVSDEFEFAPTWFVLVAIVAVGLTALYLWYGRWAGRRLLNA
ncbi:MAG: DUF4345 family protein [Acidimicrobiia bacterium]|nr:DUF4345 family protein [Acidimicrobiia bacterium]MDH3470202.1 DUF4345 family protein [Acidimicrobiia bacterium]